jgi:hypothetical protein
MKYTVYDPTTGQIMHTICATDQKTLELNLQNQTCIEGQWSGQQYYIQNGQPIELPACPTTGTTAYEFDWQTHSWQIDATQSQFQIRQHRNTLLAAIDRVNPVWYASLDSDQQAELQAYRLALLTVPQQAGFPSQVEWPTKPIWL